MSDDMTGPELFSHSVLHVRDVIDPASDEQDSALYLGIAQVQATNANTAALVMLAGLYADAHGMPSREVEAWAEVIPATPLVECWGKEARRPQCAERHTEDCDYADPVPEPKHVLLDVGTRVLVSEPVYDEATRKVVWDNPEAGRISGYDMHRSKYQWQREYGPGDYARYHSWAFVDNRVIVHPDGPECPPVPEPVKREPTGPRLYVRHPRGKDGYVVEFGRKGEEKMAALVQWHVPGVVPVWVSMDRLTVIHPDDVDRCPSGQTRDECGSGENQCELCLEAEDAEGDEIERSMGLR